MKYETTKILEAYFFLYYKQLTQACCEGRVNIVSELKKSTQKKVIKQIYAVAATKI